MEETSVTVNTDRVSGALLSEEALAGSVLVGHIIDVFTVEALVAESIDVGAVVFLGDLGEGGEKSVLSFKSAVERVGDGFIRIG